jgi:cytochrome c-type biogenesis protein CcmH
MIGLWIGAALLSAFAAVLIVYRSARATAASAQAPEDPTLAVYRRQLTEIDDLADRGLLPEGEQASARAEAARRLLTAADKPAPAPPIRPGQWLVAAAATAAPVIAAGLYLWLGSPAVPDQPFAKRLADWSKQDPSALDPQQMVAVITAAAPQHKDDPRLYYFLGQAQAAAGDPFSAERSLRKAIAMAPQHAELWRALAVLLVGQSQGEPSADALAAFAKTLSLDPSDISALYYVSRAKIGAGDVAGGLAGWTTLLGELKPDDPRRAVVTAQIAEVQKTHALPVDQPQQPAAQGADGGQQAQQAMINGMVAKLAAQLDAAPNDPAGWARLVRSYGVLGDHARQDAALAKARALFKDRPADLRAVEAALEPAQ